MKRTSSRYIHGSTAKEQRRLSRLNSMLNEAYVEAVRPRAGERVLDLGIGLGEFSAVMARAGASVVGIERDPKQFAVALRVRSVSRVARRLDFRRGDATALDLAPGEWGSFDLVHARFLLEHLPDPASVVASMVRAGRPGGRVFVSDDDHEVFLLDPEPAGFPALWRAYVRSYELLGNDPFVGRKLAGLLKAAGLTGVRNGGMFFGGSADEAHFRAIADNLIGILAGAGPVILSRRLMRKRDYDRAMDALRGWSRYPDAAQWYMLFWAEGTVPG